METSHRRSGSRVLPLPGGSQGDWETLWLALVAQKRFHSFNILIELVLCVIQERPDLTEAIKQLVHEERRGPRRVCTC